MYCGWRDILVLYSLPCSSKKGQVKENYRASERKLYIDHFYHLKVFLNALAPKWLRSVFVHFIMIVSMDLPCASTALVGTIFKQRSVMKCTLHLSAVNCLIT